MMDLLLNVFSDGHAIRACGGLHFAMPVFVKKG